MGYWHTDLVGDVFVQTWVQLAVPRTERRVVVVVETSGEAVSA